MTTEEKMWIKGIRDTYENQLYEQMHQLLSGNDLEHWIRDRLFENFIWQNMVSEFKPAMLEEVCHFCDTSCIGECDPNADWESLESLLQYLRNYTNDSSEENQSYPTKNEIALKKYGWKFDEESLLYAYPPFSDMKKNLNARKFLEDINDAQQWFGEYKKPMFLGDEL
jgi:hypothetical protein